MHDPSIKYWATEECLRVCNCGYLSSTYVENTLFGKLEGKLPCFKKLTGNHQPLATQDTCLRKCVCYDDNGNFRQFKVPLKDSKEARFYPLYFREECPEQ